MYIVLIVAHTVAGVVAFAAGCSVIRPRADVRGVRFRTYFGSLVALVIFLVAAIASHWADLETAPRLIYTVLTGLGLYMVWRGWQARTAPIQDGRYVEHVGFTLIALFDGFVIVSAIDLHAPIWLVVVIAVAGVLVGRRGVARIQTSTGVRAAGAIPSS